MNHTDIAAYALAMVVLVLLILDTLVHWRDRRTHPRALLKWLSAFRTCGHLLISVMFVVLIEAGGHRTWATNLLLTTLCSTLSVQVGMHGALCANRMLTSRKFTRPIPFGKPDLPWFLLVVAVPTALNLIPEVILPPRARYILVVVECAGTHLYVLASVGGWIRPSWSERKRFNDQSTAWGKVWEKHKVALCINFATAVVSLGMIGGIGTLSEKSLLLVRRNPWYRNA